MSEKRWQLRRSPVSVVYKSSCFFESPTATTVIEKLACMWCARLFLAALIVLLARPVYSSLPTRTKRSRALFPPRSIHRRHCHSQCNIVNFIVAAEGLVLSSRISGVLLGKKLARHELTTRVLFGMNAAVLSVWCAARLLGCENVIEWMMSNFLLPQDKQMQHRRLHTVVTSAFSHIDVDHFVSNMGALFAFAPDVVLDLGCRRFAYFYIASCYASKFFDEVFFKDECSLAVTATPSDLFSEVRQSRLL